MDTCRGAVLIVEDEPAVRQVLQLLCERLGFTAFATDSGYEAVNLYQMHRSDIRLVLLDVHMPILDGPATLTRLRDVGLNAKVVFMSAHTGCYSIESLLAFGADRFFEKPFSLETLAHHLLALTQQTRAAA
ncbi:MAG: response regulator [Gemmataceae bacterium]